MPSSGVKSRLYSPALVSWVIVALAANLLPIVAAITVIGVAGVAHSTVGFIRHGGQRFSVPGIFMYGTGLFGFFPAIYLANMERHGPTPELLVAANLLYFSQIITYYLIWKPTEVEAPVLQPATPQVRRWAMSIGFVLLTGGLYLNFIEIQDQLISAATFSGLAVYAVAAFRSPGRLTVFPYVVVVGGFVGYATLIFEGFGRLVLGTLGILIAAAVAHRWHGQLVKIVVVVIMPPVLAYLAAGRAEFAAQLSGIGHTTQSGLESVVSPMSRFAQLIEIDQLGNLAYGWGSSFFTSAVALIPRSLWPSKPDGLGRELTAIFAPQLLASNHSEAALLAGEFVYNFGIFGLLVAIPAVGFGLNWFERKWMLLNARPLDSRKAILGTVALIVLAAGVLDMAWMGTFTFMSRTGPRLLIILALFAVMGWMHPKNKTLLPALTRRQGEAEVLRTPN